MATAGKSDSPANSSKVPTFKVVGLGPSGAGKTVYLSSMFHSLNFRDGRRSYFLETSPELRIALSKVYRTLADTMQPWPGGTRVAETREYFFDCVAFDDMNIKHHLLTISYLDYSGGLLEEEQEAGSNALGKLYERINGADALLCMIDGYRVLQLLKNQTEGYSYFQFSMQTIIGTLQSASCPVHLVISKWDIVRDFGEPAEADEQLRLGLVIDALMKFDHIRSLVEQRGAHQIIRIIPVSAVGRRFARVNPTGVMVKRSDAHMDPVNVEMPLCAVVPDLFKQIESSLNDSARRMLNAELRMRAKLGSGEILSGVAAFLKRPAGMLVRTILNLALGADVGKETAMLFFDWAAQPYEKRMAVNATNRKGAELELERFERTRARVMDDFSKAVLRLEALFPNSQLGRN